MPIANLLTDEGNIATMVVGDANNLQQSGAQSVATMGGDDNMANIHVALVVLVGVALLVILRKNGFHSLMVEG